MRMPSLRAGSLRAFLSLAVALVSPGIAPYQALAQTVSVQAAVPVGGGASGAAGAAAIVSRSAPSMGISIAAPTLSLTPTMVPAALTPSLTVSAGAARTSLPAAAAEASRPVAAATPVKAIAAKASLADKAEIAVAGRAAVQGKPARAADAPSKATRGAFARLTEVSMPKAAEADASAARVFDGARRRAAFADAAEESPVAGAWRAGAADSGLRPATAHAAAEARVEAPKPAARASSRGVSKFAVVLITGGLMLAFPAVALAAEAGTVTAAAVSMLGSIHPLASAIGAGVGGLFGLFITYSRRKDGEMPSAGAVIASVLRYGIIGAAGTYVLLDLVRIPFVGLQAAALSPLSSAVATAALGQTGFQGTFADPATSSADRIMAAFPAVAGALGLSIGTTVLMASAGLTLGAVATMLAVGAMTITGVAGAFYSAMYKPGRSPDDGPARMARGYVLQALMTGLAFAVTSPWLMVPFYALAAWGFWDVIYTMIREVASLVQQWQGRGSAPAKP